MAVAAKAQQPEMPLIGILGSPTASSSAQQVAIFMQALKEVGFIEG